MDLTGLAVVCAVSLFAGAAAGGAIGTAWAKWAQAAKSKEMEQRIAGVEALLVESIGQSTKCFRDEMEGILDKMDCKKKGRK